MERRCKRRMKKLPENFADGKRAGSLRSRRFVLHLLRERGRVMRLRKASCAESWRTLGELAGAEKRNVSGANAIFRAANSGKKNTPRRGGARGCVATTGMVAGAVLWRGLRVPGGGAAVRRGWRRRS